MLLWAIPLDSANRDKSNNLGATGISCLNVIILEVKPLLPITIAQCTPNLLKNDMLKYFKNNILLHEVEALWSTTV